MLSDQRKAELQSEVDGELSETHDGWAIKNMIRRAGISVKHVAMHIGVENHKLYHAMNLKSKLSDEQIINLRNFLNFSQEEYDLLSHCDRYIELKTIEAEFNKALAREHELARERILNHKYLSSNLHSQVKKDIEIAERLQ